jgi:MoxR-like ATPase
VSATVSGVQDRDETSSASSFHPHGGSAQGSSAFVLPDDATVVRLAERFRAARSEVEKVIVGQSQLLERILIALLAGGHVLIEGVPGLAKTRTVRTFAEVLGGSWQRVQFTPDLVPSDLVGTRVWLPGEGRFSLEIGPVSTNFLLADEINRAPAKVQSALLEAMEERQVTIGRETVRLPDPFLVLATQNPLESEGTYPLPEAQTDRFMFRVVVTYPSVAEELEVVRRALVGTDQPHHALTIADVIEARAARRGVYVPKDVADAAVRLTTLTRPGSSTDGLVLAGAGPRGSLALVAAAQARALLHGRHVAVLGDVLDLAVDVLSHRVQLSHRAVLDGLDQRAVTAAVVETSGLLG